MAFEIKHGDCLEVMRGMADNSVDAVVTDPPYGLSFMGKKWDYDVPSVDVWAECLRVLKPGGHLLAFAGTRTQHRMAVRIEDAGFEIRDMIAWVYGSGFPKSLDVSKAIDKAAGAEREVVGSKLGQPGYSMAKGKPSTVDFGPQSGDPEMECAITAPATEAARQWQGWGTALKPSYEPVTVARKPLVGTVAANVLEHGTGALNIDGCRVATGDKLGGGMVSKGRPCVSEGWDRPWMHDAAVTEAKKLESAEKVAKAQDLGRWPANLIHDGSEEVVGMFPETSGKRPARTGKRGGRGFGMFDDQKSANAAGTWPADNGGSAARFFYCAKASKADRDEGCEELPEVECGMMEDDAYPIKTGSGNLRETQRRNHHPTVKPTALMRYLCRLVTPPNGTVLDPFMGSGSTGKAAVLEGFEFIGIERDAEYVAIAEARIVEAQRSLGLFA